MNKTVLFFIIVILSFITIQSCVHKPGEIIPQPIDTTGNDTTKIPKRPCNSDSVYYGKDIQPLFNAYCIGSGCHNQPSPAEGLDLTSYDKAIKSSKIKPFNGAGSDLYKAITKSGSEKMPPTGTMPSTAIALIKKWMDQGAKNLVCDDMINPCDTTKVNYTNTISKIMTEQGCVSCHGTMGNPAVTLTTYAGVKAAAMDNSRLWKAINHLSGATKAMPNSSTFISNCNIRQIKIWIDSGYPEN